MQRAIHLGLVVSLVCLLQGLVSPPAFSAVGERITEFTAAVTVNEDSTLAVTETIKVVATGEQIKRGIVRRFPLVYTGDDGQTYRVDFRIDGALLNQWDVPWHRELEGDYALIYLGDPDVFLDPGEYEFSLAYTTTNHIRYSAGHAMLNYNVTGEWDFPIESVETEVILPDVIPPEEIILQCYTGLEGSTASDCQPSLIGRTCRFRTTREFEPDEQLTVMVEFPEDALTAPPVTNIGNTSFPERKPVERTQRSETPYSNTGSTSTGSGGSSGSSSSSPPIWVIILVALAGMFGFGKLLSMSSIGTGGSSTNSGYDDDQPVEPFIQRAQSRPVNRTSSYRSSSSSSSRSSRSSSSSSWSGSSRSRSNFRSGSSGKGSGGGGGGGW